MALTALDVAFSTLEVSADSAVTWVDIPGFSDYTENEGDAASTDITAFSGTASLTGLPTPGTVSITLSAIVPTLPVFATLRDARDNAKSLHFRFMTVEEAIWERADGFDISTAGVVSFNTGPTDPAELFSYGMYIKEGTNRYPILSVAADGTVMSSPVATAVDEAGAYSVVLPGIRRGPFIARVSGGTSLTAATGGALASTLTLVPKRVLPPPVVI